MIFFSSSLVWGCILLFQVFVGLIEDNAWVCLLPRASPMAEECSGVDKRLGHQCKVDTKLENTQYGWGAPCEPW